MNLGAEIKYGLRGLLTRPGFAAIAVATLTIGIGTTTAMFSVVNAVLLRPLPYRESNRLVMLWGGFLKLDIERLPAKVAEYEDYRTQSKSFDQVAAFETHTFEVASSLQAERINGAGVTPNLFGLLDVTPLVGRTIAETDTASNQRVVIISYGLWQRRFGGDPNVITQTVRLDDQDYTIVGVMPPSFQFPPPGISSTITAELWVPITYTSEQVNQRQGPYRLNVVAKLKSEASLEQAQVEMNQLAQRFEQEYRGYRGPNGEDGGWQITVIPLSEELIGGSRRPLILLFSAVGLLLLIACANVANLLLVRATRRRKELAIRLALGATRWAIGRQLAIESLELGLVSGALGTIFAVWGVRVITTMGSAALPRGEEVTIDARVVLFTTGIAILTSLLTALAPALQTRKLDLTNSLRDGINAGNSGRDQHLVRNLIVVCEVALSAVLLIGGGLLVNSLLRLQKSDPGLAADKLLSIGINLSRSRYAEPKRVTSFYQELVDRVQALPGVQGVSFSTLQLLSGEARNDPFAVEGRALDPSNLTTAGWQMVGADYLRTLGIQLVRGRDFNEQDMNAGAPVTAVINERMAQRYWPNEDPIGKRITLGLPRPDNPWVTIIGIARDLPHRELGSKAEPDWYLSRTLGSQPNRFLLVRAAGNPQMLIDSIRREVAAIDREQPITSSRTFNQVISETMAPRRFNTWLLVSFAVTALLLAVVGLYSVISYSVTQRTREIGVRVALGAQAGDVLRLVLKSGMSFVLIGLSVGLAGALALTRLMSSLLFGVAPTDPLTFGFVSVMLVVICFVACYVPARRASKVDPMMALRYE